MLTLVDCYLVLGSKIFYSAGNCSSIGGYWNDEALGEIGVVGLRVIFSLNADQFHNVDKVVLFGAVDAKVSIDS